MSNRIPGRALDSWLSQEERDKLREEYERITWDIKDEYPRVFKLLRVLAVYDPVGLRTLEKEFKDWKRRYGL